jgi:pilus assembly protein CpaF
VREIVGVTGRTEGDIIETSDIFTTVGGALRRADGYPPHPDRYTSSGVDLAGLLAEHALAANGAVAPAGSGR